MRLIDLKCPSCGASLQIDMEAQQAFCPHCGHQLIVDDGRMKADGASFRDAGYQFEQGRMQAQREQNRAYVPPPQYTPALPDPRELAKASRQRSITRLVRWLTVIGSLVFMFSAISYRYDRIFAIAGAVAISVFVIWSHRFNKFLRVLILMMMSFVVLIRLIR